MSNWGKRTIRLVQIDQPLCSREYGDAFQSPSGLCTARLGVDGARKCHNTRFTCQDPDNYNPGTLTFQLSRAEPGYHRFGYVIPSIESFAFSAGSINLGGMDRSRSAIGEREVVTIVCEDHLHSDLLFDKYRLERASGEAQAGSPIGAGYEPYYQGTFWGKWLARNPYHSGYALRIYDGYEDQALSQMRVRNYVIDRIDGPLNGTVKIVAKDLFNKIEIKKAVAPKASRGELLSSITTGSSSFTLDPVGIGNLDYPTSGYVNIGDEIIQFTRSGDVMTVVARGALNTTAKAHDAEDLVQLVLQYSNQRAHNIVYDLFTKYTPLGDNGSPTPTSEFIDKLEWDNNAVSLTALYTGRIATPTPVLELVAELAEQAGFSVWPDIDDGMVKFKALRAGNSGEELTDGAWIVDGSLSVKEQIEERVSQVWVYYAQINPVESLDEKRNYRSRLVSIDTDAEASTQFGTPQIKEVFSRWIPQFGRGVAEDTADRLLAMFRDPPREVKMRVHADRAPLLGLAEYVDIATDAIQDVIGEVSSEQHAIIAISRDENEIGVTTRSIKFPSIDDQRNIFIENDDTNINLRTVHDTLFAAPVGGSPTGETVTFIVEDAVTVGSTSTGLPAMRTGSWPAGVRLYLTNYGRIQGKGGAGGSGGAYSGNNGGTGGDALLVEYATTIDNALGEIWGGGGGGGGGAGFKAEFNGAPGTDGAHGGGAGAPGAGYTATGGSSGGSVSVGGNIIQAFSGSSSSSSSASSAGGAGGGGSGNGSSGGSGGAGGGPGQAGSNGSTYSWSAGFYDHVTASGSFGSGGAAGRYINGIALVTWASPGNGDLRGNVA